MPFDVPFYSAHSQRRRRTAAWEQVLCVRKLISIVLLFHFNRISNFQRIFLWNDQSCSLFDFGWTLVQAFLQSWKRKKLNRISALDSNSEDSSKNCTFEIRTTKHTALFVTIWSRFVVNQWHFEGRSFLTNYYGFRFI